MGFLQIGISGAVEVMLVFFYVHIVGFPFHWSMDKGEVIVKDSYALK